MAENDEDSIWDKDEEGHEHTADCGHSDAEHARMKRVQDNFKKFLADNAEDMLDEGTFLKMKGKVEKHLREAGSSMTFTSLKIFREGFMFGMMAQLNIGADSARMLAGIGRLVREKEPKRAKIDITQSKPLPKDDGKENTEVGGQ